MLYLYVSPIGIRDLNQGKKYWNTAFSRVFLPSCLGFDGSKSHSRPRGHHLGKAFQSTRTEERKHGCSCGRGYFALFLFEKICDVRINIVESFFLLLSVINNSFRNTRVFEFYRGKEIKDLTLWGPRCDILVHPICSIHQIDALDE